MDLLHLEPKAIWKNFAALNAIPRPSKKEEKVIAFIKNFGESLGLETSEDETGNVIIRKPATPEWRTEKRQYYSHIWIWYVRRIMIQILTLTLRESTCWLMGTG